MTFLPGTPSAFTSSTLAMAAAPAPLHTSLNDFMSQPVLDDKAIRCLDVLEVDAAERWSQKFHRIDELIDIARSHFQVDRIHICETFKQHRLAFHDRFRCQRAEVSEAQD